MHKPLWQTEHIKMPRSKKELMQKHLYGISIIIEQPMRTAYFHVLRRKIIVIL